MVFRALYEYVLPTPLFYFVCDSCCCFSFHFISLTVLAHLQIFLTDRFYTNATVTYCFNYDSSLPTSLVSRYFNLFLKLKDNLSHACPLFEKSVLTAKL